MSSEDGRRDKSLQIASPLRPAKYDAKVRLWDAGTGEPIGLYPFLGDSHCFDFSPMNNMFACGDKRGNVYILRLWGIGSEAATR